MNTTPIVRTEYMQSLLDATKYDVGVEAIKGGFIGAWERLIAGRIKTDWIRDVPEACEIIESVMVKGDPATVTYYKAAKLITSSIIPSEQTEDIGID
jgi:hypothetical protein